MNSTEVNSRQNSWWKKAVSFAFDRSKILTIADINNIVNASGVLNALRIITGLLSYNLYVANYSLIMFIKMIRDRKEMNLRPR